MRAVLINPETKTIEEVDFQLGTEGERPYKGINELIGCDLFTVVLIEERADWSGESLYVDDEGLLNNPEHFFQWKGYHQPLAGKGLILGTDNEGECVGTDLTIEFVRSMVTFPEVEFDHFEEIPEHETEIHGERFFVVGNKPVFRPKPKE